ncbi:MAG: molybdopterin converting factor subunit 1 [Pseudomonadales bacterium]
MSDTVLGTRVLFFASLRESAGTDEVVLSLDGMVSLDALLDRLADVLPGPAMDALSAENVRIAVNQTLVSGAVRIAPGDEVAFLPPVTGG